MTNRSDVDEVDALLRKLLDAMRNAHLQTVLGDSARALEYLSEAKEASNSLGDLYARNPDAAAIAGRVLSHVLEDRIVSLRSLINEALKSPMTSLEVVEFVAKPLPPSKAAP